jgi:glycosyltransferase involved in cell wall biosynthesis
MLNRMPLNSGLLNVLHVVDSLEFGGLERVVTDLAKAQHALGHSVAVFSISPTQGFAPELAKAGIPVTVGGKSRGFDLEVLGKLRRLVIDRKVRVVHAHNFVPNYYSATALLALRQKVTLVGTSHDMGTRLSNRKLRWMYRASLLRTARLAMVGQQVHERYVSAGWIDAARSETVLNGIPVQRFTNSDARRRAARAQLGLDASTPLIGCVGRLVPLKNQRLMIDVLPTLLRAHPSLKLAIVGDGELDGALRQQARSGGVAGQVLFLGQRADVADLLPAFDIFALPSRTEGLSIALLEACATGLAVVATAVGGNPEIVRHGETGLLVPVDDADALRDALMTLLDDASLRGRLADSANLWVKENASIEALCSTYDRFYRRAM